MSRGRHRSHGMAAANMFWRVSDDGDVGLIATRSRMIRERRLRYVPLSLRSRRRRQRLLVVGAERPEEALGLVQNAGKADTVARGGVETTEDGMESCHVKRVGLEVVAIERGGDRSEIGVDLAEELEGGVDVVMGGEVLGIAEAEEREVAHGLLATPRVEERHEVVGVAGEAEERAVAPGAVRPQRMEVLGVDVARPRDRATRVDDDDLVPASQRDGVSRAQDDSVPVESDEVVVAHHPASRTLDKALLGV
mmetsp:Transcript_8834/g.28009  ORF Transcript_8834/g.28009 Transcript_8834/m.28009 type:complete len:251 (-) Transcript_8834:782-1534(-)